MGAKWLRLSPEDYKIHESQLKKAWHKENRAKNREALNLKARQWATSHKVEKALYNKSRYSAVDRRARQLEQIYGITLEAYNQLFEEQCGLCAICGQSETSTRLDKLLPLAVDHDHETGVIRGLLCKHCNAAIGLFKDSSETLRIAAEYIDKHVSANACSGAIQFCKLLLQELDASPQDPVA